MENKREIVIKKILGAVKRGEYPLEHQLPPERKLAQKMGVSRVIIREAVVALETLGVVEVRKRQGVFVKRQPHGDFHKTIRFMPFWPTEFTPQLMEVRLIIDVNATRIAAKKRTKDDLNKMRSTFVNLKSLNPHTDEEIKIHARYEFLLHALIVEAAHNTILSRIYEGIVSLVEKNNEILHQNFIEDIEWQNRIINHHENIIIAIEDQDETAAANAMEQHIQEASLRYKTFLENGNFKTI